MCGHCAFTFTKTYVLVVVELRIPDWKSWNVVFEVSAEREREDGNWTWEANRWKCQYFS